MARWHINLLVQRPEDHYFVFGRAGKSATQLSFGAG